MRLFRRFARLADRWENRTFGRYAARRRRYEARHFEPDAFRALVKQYGFRTVEQLEELANVLKVERIRVYNDKTFLQSLLAAYAARKEQLSQQNEQMNDKEPNGAYEKEWRNSFLRRFVQRRSDSDYRDAIAVLDGLAS